MLNHKEIKQRLPEYVRDGLIPDEVKAHLKTCKECEEELSILQTLKETPVPEPGGMFFETLPQKVRASLKKEKKKSIFFRLAPAFALIVLVVVAGYIYNIITIPTADEELLFSDPLAFQIYDLSSLSADDIPSISVVIEKDEIYLSDEPPYLREFAYLSSEEMESLYEELATENGGV